MAVFSLILGVLSVVDISGSQMLSLVSTALGSQGWVGGNHRCLLDNRSAMIENQSSTGENQASIRAKLDSIAQILDERLPSDSS